MFHVNLPNNDRNIYLTIGIKKALLNFITEPKFYLLFFLASSKAFFLYRRWLYFSSNSFPSNSLLSVKGCLQCIHASTRPSIFLGFAQMGHTIGMCLVDNIQIHK